MKFVLQLKHWQLFLLTFGIPLLAYLVMMGTMIASFASNPNIDEVPIIPIVSGGVVFLAYIVGGVFTISWAWHLATGLYKRLPTGHTMKINRFYIAFFFPMFYVFAILGGIGAFVLMNLDTLTQSGPDFDPTNFLWILLIVLPMHFFTIACAFYILYFLSKSLRTVELQRQAVANDYISEFIMLWFSFVGIWFLQPRINKIFSNEPPTAEAGGPLDRI
jgi:hypothetical protein